MRRRRMVRLASLAATALMLASCDMVPVASFSAASSAMEPTIQPGEHMFAWAVTTESLRRGDIVVVENGGSSWLSRIAGLPGDSIAMIDGIVVLNGREIAQRPAGTYTLEDVMQPGDHAMLEEQFPGEVAPHRVLDMGAGPLDDLAEITLPEGSYFLLGDNRDNAADSRLRHEYGFGLGIVTRQQITGRVSSD